MNWEWYWKVKKQHTAKALCSWFIELDSFNLFKNKQCLDLIKGSNDKTSFEIPRYKLVARLMDNDSLQVNYNDGSYVIVVEKKPCNYGGFYNFFHCPQCDKRMRKLYCVDGKFLCRKCTNLGYGSQRLRASRRCLYMSSKVKDFLKSRAGSLDQKPPWMKKRTFERLKNQYLEYREFKYTDALQRELLSWYQQKADMILKLI